MSTRTPANVFDSVGGRGTTSPLVTIFSDRAPTGNDINYLQGQRWVFENPALSAAITAIPNSASGGPTVVTANNFFTPGMLVTITGVVGMTQINNGSYYVIDSTPSEFTINVDSSTWGTYVSGGTAVAAKSLEYILESVQTLGGYAQANWTLLATEPEEFELFLAGNTGGLVPPNVAGIINVVGDGTTVDVVGDPATNTLTISAVSSGEVASITATAPLTANGVSGTPETGAVTVAITTPLTVPYGGTGDATVTAYAPICGGTTTTAALQSAATGISNIGYVLTSTGATSLPTWQVNAASGDVSALNGDTGTATPSGGIITITGATSGAHFSGSGSTLTETFNYLSLPTTTASNGQILINGNPALQFFGNNNQFIGGAGNFTLSTATGNFAAGGSVLTGITTGNYNVLINSNQLSPITSGSNNILLGVQAGYNLSGSDSNNIILGISAGPAGSSSNTLYIGSSTGTGPGELQAAFIQGIAGVTVSNADYVVIDSSTGQLGTTSAPIVQTTGTWTPTVYGATTAGTTTYTNQYGFYVKTGVLVEATCYVSVSAATGTGFLVIDGLPFTIANLAAGQPQGACTMSGSWTFPSNTTSISATGALNTTTVSISASGSGANSSFVTMTNANATFVFTLVYQST